jgi:hypothetical protein
MRPILWGTIWFVIGLIGWVAFSVFAALGSIEGNPDTFIMALMYIFGIVFFFSLPVAVIAEIILWIRRRQKKTP